MEGVTIDNDDWNKIKIIKKLGEGSMGQVWLVHYEISEGHYFTVKNSLPKLIATHEQLNKLLFCPSSLILDGFFYMSTSFTVSFHLFVHTMHIHRHDFLLLY
jgi:hypothetical protein